MREKECDSSVVEKKEVSFHKDQLLNSKKYKGRKDVLSVLLKEDTLYTLKQVDVIMEDYQKRSVR